MALWPRRSPENKFVFERDLLDFQTNPRIFRALQRSLFCALPCDLVGKCATAGRFKSGRSRKGRKVCSPSRLQVAVALSSRSLRLLHLHPHLNLISWARARSKTPSLFPIDWYRTADSFTFILPYHILLPTQPISSTPIQLSRKQASSLLPTHSVLHFRLTAQASLRFPLHNLPIFRFNSAFSEKRLSRCLDFSDRSIRGQKDTNSSQKKSKKSRHFSHFSHFCQTTHSASRSALFSSRFLLLPLAPLLDTILPPIHNGLQLRL